MTRPGAKPEERGRSLAQRALFELCRYATALLMAVVYRLRIYHAHRVPREGACLLASNHVSHLDPPAIGQCVLHRQMRFVARSTLFGNRVFGWLITALGSIPVRQDGGGDLAAIRAVLGELDRGAVVLMFPEGSRSVDGTLQPFKRGAALLVSRSRCPVVPVAIEGTFEAWPRSKRFPRLLGSRIGICFGEPIPHNELLAGGADAALDRLASEIGALQIELRERMAKQRIVKWSRDP